VWAPLVCALMPSDKRQRQDEGRLLRLEEQRLATQKVQRKRQFKSLGLILGGIIVVAGALAIFGSDSNKTVDTAAEGTTSTTADGSSTTAAGAGDPAIGDSPCPPPEGAEGRTTTFASGPQACIDPAKSYTATVVTSRGEFTAELYPDQAPKAVNNFVFLSRHHFYDTVPFHRVIPGFMVQGGDAIGNPPGTGGPGYEFADELPTEGPPYYEVGSLAMANSGPDTNGSQFFVVTGQQGVDLPASYTLFGKVTKGMDVVKEIEATGTADGTPKEKTTIKSVTITES
jgi:cyclophilin family peptidyl-prolyl cis-trans isomerase